MNNRKTVVPIALLIIFVSLYGETEEVLCKDGVPVLEWIKDEYGERSLDAMRYDRAVGLSAVSDWVPSHREKMLAFFLAEGYCRFTLSDEINAYKQGVTIPLYGVESGPPASASFHIKEKAYSSFKPSMTPFMFVHRNVRTNEVKYIAVLYKETASNETTNCREHHEKVMFCIHCSPIG